MQHGKFILISLITAALAGCAVTNPSSEPRPSDAPPKLVMSSTGEETKTDVKATYSTVAGNGTMTGASVSIPTSTAETSSVPRIPNANEEAKATVGAQTTIPTQQAATTTQQTSLAGGFAVPMAYQKAWTTTEKALSSAGYPIMEKDESTGTYYVLDKASSGGKVQRDTPIYQVRLTKSGDNTQIALLNANGQPASADISNRILSALKGKLS